VLWHVLAGEGKARFELPLEPMQWRKWAHLELSRASRPKVSVVDAVDRADLQLQSCDLQSNNQMEVENIHVR